MAWPLNADGTKYLFEGTVEIPVSPDTGAAILMLRPQGGILVGVPPIEQGDPGSHAEISSTINFTELEPGDPTAASASWTTLTPPTTSTPGVYRLNLALHAGSAGADGDTVLDPADFGGGTAGQILVVKNADEFELAPQKFTECFFPATVNNTASGTANSTLATIPIPSRPYARRVRPIGYTVVTGEGTDVRVDLIARLGSESGGNIVGRCPGIAQTERLTLLPGKAAGTADAFDTIAAGATSNVYIRCERQAGSVTYTTSASTSLFSVEVLPL